MHLLLAAAVVTVRIYNYAAVPAEQMAGARAAADRIFKDAGISLAWLDCRVPGAVDGDACDRPLRPTGEFVLRLLARAGDAVPAGRIALGSSLLDRDAGNGVLITIDPHLVDAVAGQAGAETPALLGQAIAHELGHLLIGTPEHAATGLMRAYWSQDELRSARPEDRRFSPQEADVMRHALSRGARAAN